jgi:hypothetical protein
MLAFCRNWRASPLFQSQYEDRAHKFFPAYGPKQLREKSYHTVELLKKLEKNVTLYTQLPESKQAIIDLTIVEELIAHPDTELYMNVMGQGREPIAVALNRGEGDYPIQNHVGTFERRPEVFDYNSYISNYQLRPEQLEAFDLTNGTSTTYEDLLGNPHTNTVIHIRTLVQFLVKQIHQQYHLQVTTLRQIILNCNILVVWYSIV